MVGLGNNRNILLPIELAQGKVENASEMSFPAFLARLPSPPLGQIHLKSNAQNSVPPQYYLPTGVLALSRGPLMERV